MLGPENPFNFTVGASTAGGSPWSSASGQTGGPAYTGTNAGTEFDRRLNVFEKRLDGVETEMRVMKVELQSEIRDVLAAFREGESARKTAYSELTGELGKLTSHIDIEVGKLTTNFDGAKDQFATAKTVRNWVLTGFGGVVAAAALAWAIFDTGAGIAGSVASEILESK